MAIPFLSSCSLLWQEYLPWNVYNVRKTQRLTSVVLFTNIVSISLWICLCCEYKGTTSFEIMTKHEHGILYFYPCWFFTFLRALTLLPTKQNNSIYTPISFMNRKINNYYSQRFYKNQIMCLIHLTKLSTKLVADSL